LRLKFLILLRYPLRQGCAGYTKQNRPVVPPRGRAASVLAWFASWPEELQVLLVVLLVLWSLGEWSFTGLFFRARRWWTRGA